MSYTISVRKRNIPQNDARGNACLMVRIERFPRYRSTSDTAP